MKSLLSDKVNFTEFLSNEQCGNLLLHFFGKNFVKVMLYNEMDLLDNWFDEIFME